MEQAELQNLISLIKNKELEKAADLAFSIIELNPKMDLIFLLDSIREIISLGGNLKESQIETLKRFFNSFDAAIQDTAMELYFQIVLSGVDYFLMDKSYILEELFSPNYVIRERMLDLLSAAVEKHYPIDDTIIQTSLKLVKDRVWSVRNKLIEFYKKLLEYMPERIEPHRRAFLELLKERDLDVANEALDFIYHLFLKLYTREDFDMLMEMFPKQSWTVQKRLLYLMGKIGQVDIEKIKPYIRNSIKLLDYDNDLVQRKVAEVLFLIMQKASDILDENFMSLIKNEEIENLEEIERILSLCVIKNREKRYLDLYFNYMEDNLAIIQVMANILRKVAKADYTLAQQIFTELTVQIFNSKDVEKINRFKKMLKLMAHYDYLIVPYKIVSNIPEYSQSEEGKEFLKYLRSLVPQLEYKKITEYIAKRIDDRPEGIKISEIEYYFGISHKNMADILKIITEEENWIIDDNYIRRPITGSNELGDSDLKVFKRWIIDYDPIDNSPIIGFATLVKNTSNKTLENVSVTLINPQDVFYSTDETNLRRDAGTLSKSKSFESTWYFKKRTDIVLEPKVTFFKLVIFYEKEGKIRSWSKKLDILLV